MEFRTRVQAPKVPFCFSHQDRIMSIGSCFAQNIHQRLAQRKFRCILNPCGILYNPVSIAHTLSRVIQKKLYIKEELIQHQGLWHSWEHHSRFSGTDPSKVLDYMNKQISEAHFFLQQTTRLIITLGTAHAYRHRASQNIVANCHKVPAQAFEQVFLMPKDVFGELYPVLQILLSQNTNLHILLTVSPIRHIRLGLVENQRSKATLLLAVHQLCDALERTFYFPSYELLLDDLRDYRFYASDMVHPSEQAIDYIWEVFSDHYFEAHTRHVNQQIHAIQKAAHHQPFYPQSAQYQAFVQTYLQKTAHLMEQHPYLDFSEEQDKLKNSLSNNHTEG